VLFDRYVISTTLRKANLEGGYVERQGFLKRSDLSFAGPAIAGAVSACVLAMLFEQDSTVIGVSGIAGLGLGVMGSAVARMNGGSFSFLEPTAPRTSQLDLNPTRFRALLRWLLASRSEWKIQDGNSIRSLRPESLVVTADEEGTIEEVLVYEEGSDKPVDLARLHPVLPANRLSPNRPDL
jgi:hypothetical protein